MGKDLSEHWQQICAPKDRRPIYEWLKDHFEVSPPLTETGKFDVQKSRHLIGPFDSFQSEFKREINLLAPVRGAKSLFADGAQLWTIPIRPGPMLYLFQDEKAVKDHAEARTWINIEKCVPVASMLSKDRHMNRTLDVIFPHMVFHMRGPAPSNLQSRGYQLVFVDEPWQYKNGTIEEARGRLGDYAKKGTDKFICLSQGGYVREDWDTQYNSGLIHEWQVQCLSCGHYMFPIWSGTRQDGSRWGMMWDKHKMPSGEWNIAKCLPTVRFECEACGHPHIWNGRTKTEWNRTGKYLAEVADHKMKTKDSFHWTAVIDYPWDQLLDLYLKAVNSWKYGNPSALVAFFMKRMAEMCSEERLLENKLNWSKSKYEISNKPTEAVRILTADRQEEDVYWVMARDWFKATPEKRAHTRRVWFGKLFSASEIEKKREELGISQNGSGHGWLLFIDSGYKPKGDHGVYRDCIKYGWIPVKGAATELGEPLTFTHSFDNEYGQRMSVERSYSMPVPVDAESGRGSEDMVEMIRFSSPTYADRVTGLIERGLWIEPEGQDNDPMERELKKQMTSEYKRAIQVGNKLARKTKHIWVCPSGNNHGFDCAKIQAFAATVLGIVPDLEEAA